ncbi:Non-specific lipid transfer protein GPI-anchored 1 [Sesamum angolense]|uniref:Non-specific lipid transfer protein GPI-anchored 1 n=1 Tax=Sesamum angolense TaxID=2727404 RepID=A0AAE2BYQ6_9LAMI|nr:Non-specific lipid transfer protein GPI-anchored 1 [Sesamum angolense]
MEIKKSSSTRWFLATLLCLAALGIAAVADDSIAGKCSSEFTKVTQCLPFVTSKAAVPSKECCDSVTDLKDTNPACICYIIQQIHNGSNAAVKSMGVQESRLLQLQSACKLANASVSECPKLLHLPPNSPDAAIFTNTNTSTATTTTPVATPSTSTSTTGSNGYWDKPQLAGYVIVALAIFFHAFPTGTSSPIAL